MVAEWDAVRLPEQTQQYEDEVGDLESVYDIQDDFSNVFANVPAERNLTLALIASAEETPAPKVKKTRKSRAKKVSIVEPEVVPSAEEIAENEQMGLEDHDAPAPPVVVVAEVVAPEPKKKRAYNKKPKAEAVAPAEKKVVVGKTITIKVKKNKKANLIIEDEEPEVVAEATPEPVVEVVPEVSRRYVAEGIMNKSFYETYIKENMTKKGQSLMDEIFGEEDAEECENFVEYRVCSWGNSYDGVCEYSEMWFLDCETEAGFYYPVAVSNINTSSGYAMCRCGMDRDADNEEDEANLMLTDEEILALVKPRNHEAIRKVLQAKRTDGK
jgi:hypothetical protein